MRGVRSSCEAFWKKVFCSISDSSSLNAIWFMTSPSSESSLLTIWPREGVKSPLAILLANLESFCVEKMRGYVIIAETGRLSSLVENLLSISKMDMSRSGNFEVKKQNINVSKICDTIIDRVRGNFIHEDKAIINDINIKDTYIYANENDLIRCLENIFSNCLRYCKTSVTFSCKRDQASPNVIFQISDDGPGIAPEVLDHLFERFSKGADGKHGIGLALAKAIAEEHNGRINAYNKSKGGACFEVILPVIVHRDQLSKINNDSTK